jgi:hypothetical protein
MTTEAITPIKKKKKVYLVRESVHRTIIDAEESIKELRKRKYHSGAGRLESEFNDFKEEQIAVIRARIKQLALRYEKGIWEECYFGDLAPGVVFKSFCCLTDEPLHSDNHEHLIHTVRPNNSGGKEHTFMKSSGTLCILISKGLDQGMLVTLKINKPVLTRRVEPVGSPFGDGSAARREFNAEEDEL